MTDRPTQPVLESVHATVRGVRMHARVALGHAPPGVTPVVLVHGLSVASGYMAPLARELAPHAPVLAPDLPGFGQSEAVEPLPTVPDLAAWLGAWMDAEGLRRASFVGNSLGCQVIAEFASRHPNRVERIVFIGPTLGTASVGVQAGQIVLDAFREDPRLWFVHLRDDVRAGPTRILGTFRSSLRHPLKNVLPRVDAPLLVVRGTRDPLVSRQDAREAALLARRGRVMEIEGATHAANFSQPRRVARAIAAFLREGEAAERSVVEKESQSSGDAS